jgi:hypothetical protein
MVEATPAPWRDTCQRCGRGFAPGESRWVEQRSGLVHTECAQWELWAEPPYSWKLKELRKQYRAAQPEQRARIAEAGRAIRQAQAQWPAHAVEHVQCVLEAVHGLG